MKLKKSSIKLIGTVSCVVIWLIMCFIALLVGQGTSLHWQLDTNYELCGWPGFIIKTTEPNAYDMYLLKINKGIDRFLVNTNFIVGKSSDGWFAINRMTHQVWESYPSAQDLQLANGVEFSESELNTSRPWSLLIIYQKTKIILSSITLVFVIMLILIWRAGRVACLCNQR